MKHYADCTTGKSGDEPIFLALRVWVVIALCIYDKRIISSVINRHFMDITPPKLVNVNSLPPLQFYAGITSV